MYIRLQENNLGLSQVIDIQSNVAHLFDHQQYISISGNEEPFLGQYYVNGTLVPQDKYDEIVEPLIRPQIPEPEPIAPIVQDAPVDTEIVPDEPPPDSELLPDPNAPWFQPTEENLRKVDQDIIGITHLIEHISKPENHDESIKTIYIDFKLPELVQLKVPKAIVYSEDTLADYIADLQRSLASMTAGRELIAKGLMENTSKVIPLADLSESDPPPLDPPAPQ